jgi:hypothetical protein
VFAGDRRKEGVVVVRMRWLCLLGFLGLGLVPAVNLAKTKLDVTGEVRYRGHIDARDFDRSTDPLFFSEIRTRINLNARPRNNLELFIQIQDSRIAGSNSGGLRNDTNLGLHQSYFRWGMGKQWYFQAGRFIMNFGNQRLVGAVEWHNVGRTWDGARFLLDQVRWRIDLFLVKRNETSFLTSFDPPKLIHSGDDDHNFSGLHFKLKELKVEGFVYYDRDATPDTMNTAPDDSDFEEYKRSLNRWTIGIYTARTFAERWDYIVNGAFQLGRDKRWFRNNEPDPAEKSFFATIAAWMITFEGGYTFSGAFEPRVAFLVDYASGDDDSLDDQINSFNNLYYTGHKFRGYMDYFLGSNRNGLMDLALRYEMKVAPKWKLAVDLHHFSSAVNIASEDGTSHAIGEELDITVLYKQDWLGVLGGVSGFSKKANAVNYAPNIFVGPDANAWWTYIMFSASF